MRGRAPAARHPIDELRRAASTVGNAATARLLSRVIIDDNEVTTDAELAENELYPHGRTDKSDEQIAAEDIVIAALLETRHSFNEQQWQFEVELRGALIVAAECVQSLNAYGYNRGSDAIKLPEPWAAIGRGEQAFVPRQGESRHAAIIATLAEELRDGSYFLDCSSAIALVQYHALATTLGQAEFDKRYSRDDVVVNVEGLKEITIPHGRRGPPPQEQLYDEVKLQSEDELLPGDCVYFQNYTGYEKRHPDGFWAGEHAVCTGPDKFKGFGVDAVSSATMVETLTKWYNADTPKAQRITAPERYRNSLSGFLPGIVLVRRVKNLAPDY